MSGIVPANRCRKRRFQVKPKLTSILSVLILTVLGSVLSAPPVFANPACGATLNANTTLTANIGPCSGNGLIIGQNGITLNCAGHTISGQGNVNFGVFLNGVTNVTVKNCKATAFNDGFELVGSSSNTLTGNTATNNQNAGFDLSGSSSNTLTGNTANNDYLYGFSLESSSNGNTLTKNHETVTVNYNGPWSGGIAGFSVLSSSGNTLTANTATGNQGIGFEFSSSSGNTLAENTATGNYQGGFSFYMSCNGNTLTTNAATSNVGFAPIDGFYLQGSSNTLTTNTATGNSGDGFELYGPSNGNTFTTNTATGNGSDGFELYGASSNTLTKNKATSNSGDGFELDGYDGPAVAALSSSNGNTLTTNTATSNGAYGFDLQRSSNGNTLTTNSAISNQMSGYYDTTVSSSPGVPNWDTANSYGTTVAKVDDTGDTGAGNSGGFAAGNPNIATATSPF